MRSAGTSGGPSKKKKHPLPARSNAASSLEESRQRYKVSTFGSSGPRTDSGLCRGLKSLHYWQISGTSLCSTPWTILRWSFDQIGCVAMVYSTVNWVCWSTDKVWHVALFNSIVNQPCLSIDKVWHVDLFNSMVTECLVLLTKHDKSSCPLLVTTCYSVVHSCDKLLRCFIRGFHTTVELCQMTTCVGGSSLAHTAHEVSSWHYRNNKFTLKWFADIL